MLARLLLWRMLGLPAALAGALILADLLSGRAFALTASQLLLTSQFPRRDGRAAPTCHIIADAGPRLLEAHRGLPSSAAGEAAALGDARSKPPSPLLTAHTANARAAIGPHEPRLPRGRTPHGFLRTDLAGTRFARRGAPRPLVMFLCRDPRRAREGQRPHEAGIPAPSPSLSSPLASRGTQLLRITPQRHERFRANFALRLHSRRRSPRSPIGDRGPLERAAERPACPLTALRPTPTSHCHRSPRQPAPRARRRP